MSDAEWDRWKATWNQGEKPMPDVLIRAKTDRRRARIGLAAVYVIGAGEIAFAAFHLARGASALSLVTPLVLAAVPIALVAGMHRILRGTWDEVETPLGLLAALEKRNEARRRLGKFVARMMRITILATFALVAAAMVAAGHFAPGLALMTLVGGASTALFTRVVVRRADRQIERDLAETREARRLLAEGEE